MYKDGRTYHKSVEESLIKLDALEEKYKIIASLPSGFNSLTAQHKLSIAGQMRFPIEVINSTHSTFNSLNAQNKLLMIEKLNLPADNQHSSYDYSSYNTTYIPLNIL